MVLEVVFVAGEHGKKLTQAQKTSDHVSDQILDEYDTCKDSNIYMCAQSSIIALLIARRLDRSVYEALAIATAAQYRAEEAISLHQRVLSMQGSLSPNIWLTTARFSSQTPDALLRFSVEEQQRVVTEKSMFGAAASGNMEMMTRLYSLGIPLDLKDADETLIKVAASHGCVSIFRCLFNHTLAFSRHHSAAITQEAAIYGHSNIILYLMSVGAFIDWTHLIDAIHYGNIHILRDLLEKKPSIKLVKGRQRFDHCCAFQG